MVEENLLNYRSDVGHCQLIFWSWKEVGKYNGEGTAGEIEADEGWRDILSS
jgi:hypothetical protein